MNSSYFLFAGAGIILFAIGFSATILSQNPFRKIISLNVMGSGVFLSFIALGSRAGSIDPTSQAMVLTGIVVAVAATALGLALMLRLNALADDERGDDE